MKTAYSDVKYAKKVASLQAQALHVNPPAIPFRKKKPKKDSEEDKEDEKARTKSIKIKIDTEDAESETLEVKVTIFEEGDAEEWIKWRMQLDELIRDVPLTSFLQRIKVAKSLLKGQARDFWETAVTNLVMQPANEEEPELTDEQIFTKVAAGRSRKELFSKRTLLAASA
jgi:hypothetical protein